MARARMIKPAFFTNEELPDLDAHTRLLFIGLWTIADREGRLEDRPRKINAELFPYEHLDIDGMLSNLGRKGFIHRYTVDEIRYIQVVNFLKHQRPHHNESESNIPEPPQDFPRSKGLATKDESASALNIDALTLNIDALDGEEPAQAPEPAPTDPKNAAPKDDSVNKRSGKTSKPRKAPLTFCPETFPLEDRHYKYGAEKGLTRAEVERETEKFLNWHTAKQTQYGDWYKTWQNWIIGAGVDKEKVTPFPQQAPQSPEDARLERTRKRIAYLEAREWASVADREQFKGEIGEKERQRQLDFFRRQLAELEQKAGAA